MTTPTCGCSEGDICHRRGCRGTIQTHPAENCSCHLSAPCSSCLAPRNFCPTCGWEESDDTVLNDYVVNVNPVTGAFRTWTPRPLDPTKLDWHNVAHTSSSMIKRGVYPEGMTREDVRKEVDGTFGGRFNYFDNGKFEFVAYTD